MAKNKDGLEKGGIVTYEEMVKVELARKAKKASEKEAE